MTAENTVNFEEASEEQDQRRHERSTIAFPYHDLDTAIDVARSVYNRAGLSPCELDELAAEMRITLSGTFRLKTSSAKLFGFIEKEGRSAVRLTSLGRDLVQGDEEATRATAFLKVPLYNKIFEEYRGHLLPPAKALEREMTRWGVASKQAAKARQTFERAAQQAGFFAQGDDRLVRPRTKSVPSGDEPEPTPSEKYETGGTGGGSEGGNGSGKGSGKDTDTDPSKPLEYQLIDLLKDTSMQQEHKEAVWTLVQFLSEKDKKEGPDV